MARRIRRPEYVATRPSCCSTHTPGPSPGRCDRAAFGHALDDPDPRDDIDSAPYVPRSVLLAGVEPDWGDERRPERPIADSIFYEVHVKGFTKLHPEVPEQLRRTYAAWRIPPRSRTSSGSE